MNEETPATDGNNAPSRPEAGPVPDATREPIGELPLDEVAAAEAFVMRSLGPVPGSPDERRVHRTDEVNGPTSEQRDCRISRHEAGLLVEHWVRRIVEIEAQWRSDGQLGSYAVRMHPHARGRVDALVGAGLIDGPAVQEILGRVRREAELMPADVAAPGTPAAPAPTGDAAPNRYLGPDSTVADLRAALDGLSSGQAVRVVLYKDEDDEGGPVLDSGDVYPLRCVASFRGGVAIVCDAAVAERIEATEGD